MKITEINGDLFTVSDEYYLAHCISGDYALGAGIAKVFRDRFDMRTKLFNQYGDLVGDDSVGKALLVDNVFNLVTKSKYYRKPTYFSLEETLIDMKRQCAEKGIKNLAMPHIGCGLDKLDWTVVLEMIKDVFKDTDIEIRIYEI